MGRIMGIAVLMAFCLCISSAAPAEQIDTKWSAGIVGGGIFPKDSEADNTFYVGGNLAYGINDYVAIGGEVGYSRSKIADEGVDFGKLSEFPLLADLYLRYPIKVGNNGNMFVPYGVGGVGVVFWDFEESSALKDLGISMDTKDSVGYKAGLGADYYFTKNVSIGVEGAYLWSDVDIKASADGISESEDFDADQWIVTGSIKYHF